MHTPNSFTNSSASPITGFESKAKKPNYAKGSMPVIEEEILNEFNPVRFLGLTLKELANNMKLTVTE